jgi:LysR family transcriptional regulator, cyn operon transcriptional activator
MPLRPLRYLKAVADHGSFTRAASALHVSQPALSQQIREFEERMGVQMLDRSGSAGTSHRCGRSLPAPCAASA